MTDADRLPPGVSPTEAELFVLTEVWIASTVILLAGDEVRTEMLFGHLEAMADSFRDTGRAPLADILDGWVARLDAGTAELRHALDNP